MKQQSTGRHVAPLWYIIMIPSQPVTAVTPQWRMLNGESAKTNLIVIGLTLPVFEPTKWLATGQWFSPGTPVSSTNKTADRNDITEILLKVALNTTNRTHDIPFRDEHAIHYTSDAPTLEFN